MAPFNLVSEERSIDFWLDLGSNYSYLTIHRMTNALEGTGVSVRWKPFLLGAVFKDLGWSSSPFVLQKTKGAYVKRDMERRARKYGLEWRWPPGFTRSTLLSTRVAICLEETEFIEPFCKAISSKHFLLDADINSKAVVGPVLDNIGLSATDILERAESDEIKNRLRSQTDMAKSAGIFGAPSFVVGNELFWGDDRLEDAVDEARGIPNHDKRV